MVGKLVGQYSDSNRVSQSLQTLSRESKKLKHYKSREGRERESVLQAFIRGEDWLCIRELWWKIGPISMSQENKIKN